MRVVFEAGVVFSGAGWSGEAHLCLMAMVRRRVIAPASPEIVAKLWRVVDEVGFKARPFPCSILDWHFETVKMVSPAPLGKQRLRDAKANHSLACALAVEADVVVSRDEDLLVW